DLTELAQEAKAQSRLRIDGTQADELQRLAREVAVDDIGRDRKPVRRGIVRHADKFRGMLPPFMMALGLPTGQCTAVLDEGRSVEIAHATNVGIESQIAAKAQHRRDLQLDDLLAVPPRHHIESTKLREKLALAVDRHVDVREGRQPRPDHLEVPLWRYDK